MVLPIGQRDRAVFIDTSAFYARLDRRDQRHEQARRGFRQIHAERRPAVTTNLVVAETYRLALHRLGPAHAGAWLDSLHGFYVVHQNESEFRQTVDLLHDHSGLLTFTDAAALVTMDAMGLGLAFTFDRHLARLRHTPFP